MMTRRRVLVGVAVRTGRLEAFSDGVLAIIITIMVLELHDPEGTGWHDLRSALPTVLTYLLSFAYIGIYWTNHHHLIAATETVSGAVLWANLHLLFWLSLVPWTTSWMGSTDFAQVPTAVYGVSLLLPAIAYLFLQQVILRRQDPNAELAAVTRSGWKGFVSPALYALGLVFALARLMPVALICYAAVAVLWIVPDRRIEAALRERAQ